MQSAQPFLDTLLLEYARLRELLTHLNGELDHTAAQGGRPMDAHQVRRLLERLRQVDIAHHIRDGRGLFDRIGQRCPPLGPVLDRMQAEHARMEPMYRELVAALDGKRAEPQGAHAELAKQVGRFVEVMQGHLGVEENYILPVATDFLTAQDWDDMYAVQARRAA